MKVKEPDTGANHMWNIPRTGHAGHCEAVRRLNFRAPYSVFRTRRVLELTLKLEATNAGKCTNTSIATMLRV